MKHLKQTGLTFLSAFFLLSACASQQKKPSGPVRYHHGQAISIPFSSPRTAYSVKRTWSQHYRVLGHMKDGASGEIYWQNGRVSKVRHFLARRVWKQDRKTKKDVLVNNSISFLYPRYDNHRQTLSHSVYDRKNPIMEVTYNRKYFMYAHREVFSVHPKAKLQSGTILDGNGYLYAGYGGHRITYPRHIALTNTLLEYTYMNSEGNETYASVWVWKPLPQNTGFEQQIKKIVFYQPDVP